MARENCSRLMVMAAVRNSRMAAVGEKIFGLRNFQKPATTLAKNSIVFG